MPEQIPLRHKMDDFFTTGSGIDLTNQIHDKTPKNQNMPRFKKSYYTLYGISALSIVILSLIF